MTGRLLGREPVMTISTIVALLIAVLPVFGWSGQTVGAVAAALVLAGGAAEAAMVSVDRALPLLVGVAKAVLAAVASFGVHLPDNHVAALMAALTVVAGLATRAQVGAIEPPRDRDGTAYPRAGVGEFTLRTDDEIAQTRGEDPESGHHMRTEVISAVSTDGFAEPMAGPASPSGVSSAQGDGEREHRPRHGQRYGSHSGELRPGFGL